MNTFFLVHKGNPEYLKLSINSIKQNNSNCNIVLIGDEANAKLSNVEHCDIKEVSTMAQKFASIYKHLSSNSYDYEFFCICRWFYILEYMKNNNISSAYYQDSDVILNCDISDVFLNDKYLYCFDSGHTSYFTIEILNRLCKFIFDMYENRFEELLSIYDMKKHNNQNEGISDMTLISLFAFNNENMVRDLSRRFNNSIFDHNVNCCDGCQMIYGKKMIFLNNGEIMVKDNKVNKYISMRSIHFQGDSKRYMKYIVNYPDEKGIYYFDYPLLKWIIFNDNKVLSENKFQHIVLKFKDIKYKITKKIEILKAFIK